MKATMRRYSDSDGVRAGEQGSRATLRGAGEQGETAQVDGSGKSVRQNHKTCTPVAMLSANSTKS